MVNVGADQEKEERDALTSSVAMDEENSNLLHLFNDLSFDSRSSKWTVIPLPQKNLTDQIYSPAPAPRKQKPSPRLLHLLRLRFPSPPRSLLPRSDLSAKAAVFDAILVSETCSWNLCCFFCVSDRRFLSLFFGWDRGIGSRRIGNRGEMSVSISVMTFNLHEGDLPSDSPNSWAKRRDLCVSVITNYSPTILCTQGGLKWQLEYLQQCLPAYEQFGVSRKGSQDTTDEYCTIFYDKDKVELLEGGTFWLSESPSVPGSISWGATAPSIATWATFQLKRVEPPGFSFQIVNTNLDEFSHRARRRSALLTWQHIASLPPNLPVIYCGGFNSQKESTTGRFLLGRSREHGVVGDMRDAWLNARTRKNVSLIHTNHGFKGNKQGAMEFLKLILRALCLCWDRQTQDLHVDWILFRGRSLVPTTCEVVNDNIDGFYPSSHYPVFAEFMLPRSIRLVETS